MTSSVIGWRGGKQGLNMVKGFRREVNCWLQFMSWIAHSFCVLHSNLTDDFLCPSSMGDWWLIMNICLSLNANLKRSNVALDLLTITFFKFSETLIKSHSAAEIIQFHHCGQLHWYTATRNIMNGAGASAEKDIYGCMLFLYTTL